MYSLLKRYGKTNQEKFNKDFIYLKDSDTVLTHINSIFKALEVIDGVKFLGATINTDESTFPDWKTDKTGEKNFVNVEESRYQLINFSFKLSDKKDGEKIIEKYLFFPKLIDKTYFILNGNKYFPIYQIIDCCTYSNNGALTLKTLLMLITLRTREASFYTYFDEELSGKVKVIDLFKNKLNYLYYFFAEKGFENTMKYLIGKDWEEKMFVGNIDDYDLEDSKDDYLIFQLSSEKEGNTVLFIDRELNDENPSLVLNIVDILNGRDEFQIVDINYWKLELGKIFSRNKNNYESKAHDILVSFKRILDNSTKNNLRLKDENKEDIFAIIRWMAFNFEELITRDNMDLKYKRIRINEYLFYELLIKMSNITYRLLNKSEINMKDREQLFSTLGPMFIIKKINQNELSRYMGGVNAIELFNPSLKFSFRGYQGLGEGSKNVNKAYRGLHHSYIGKIGLTASSAGDPGMSGTFTPFLENNGFYFSDEMLD